MANDYCELELRIDWLDRGRYFLSARFMNPANDEENQLLDPVEIHIDLDELRQLVLDAQGYGQRLTAMVFGDASGAMRKAYEKARDFTVGAKGGLRIRLTIQASAPELHGLHWESLCDPRDGTPLLTQESVWFSRFSSAQEFRLQPVKDADELRALVVIANPSDLDRWGLAAISPEAEMVRIGAALNEGGQLGGRPIRHRRLESAATIYNIVTSLRESYADILCLICHGTLVDGTPRLILAKDDGTAQSVDGGDLVIRLRDMTQRPRLVLLISCESAGDSQGRALAAIGPQLAAAGVPSVIAMQGKIGLESAARFLKRLLAELVRDGQIDRAMAVARNDIRDRPDWWMPVLFMRLKTGRLWPASVVDAQGFDKWDSLVNNIEDRECVPVLGPGLVESVLGSTRDIARKWAERYEFPLAPRNRDDLAQVAQYLTYRKDKSLAIKQLRSHLVAFIRDKYRPELEELGVRLNRDLLNEPVAEGIVKDLISLIGQEQRRRDPGNVHALLARLPVPVFITTNYDNLLRDALDEAGKSPRVMLCNWVIENDTPRRLGRRLPPAYVPTPDYEPSVQEPLIFHVFGNLDDRESLVLTEDDYFDFLIAVTRNETLKEVSIPRAVTSALASSGLLLLGFRVDDWDFRVLFRGILQQPGQQMGRAPRFTRVAVQMNPTEGEIIDPVRASSYLKSYFSAVGKIDTFWGSADEFMKTLADRRAIGGD